MSYLVFGSLPDNFIESVSVGEPGAGGLMLLGVGMILGWAAFPSILLLATLLRLALNVASTRVVLLNGHTGTEAAGKVIQALSLGYLAVLYDNSYFGSTNAEYEFWQQYLVCSQGTQAPTTATEAQTSTFNLIGSPTSTGPAGSS